MRCVLQRVDHAKVAVSGEVVGAIGLGLLLLVGFEAADDQDDMDWMVRKIANMRLFPDEEGVMNRSVSDAGGGLLIVSQFTLHASTKKGNRPSYIKADAPESAEIKYNRFVAQIQGTFSGLVATGSFGAMMDVSLLNNGPVTIWLDSKNKE